MNKKKIGKDFCAIDFETACYQRASACAVGLIRIRNSIVVENFYTLIKPPDGMEIIPTFTDIHGITMDDVDTAPDFGKVWPAIKDFIGDDFGIVNISSVSKYPKFIQATDFTAVTLPL